MSRVNISKQNIQGKCDLKCFLNFDYKNTNLIARNDKVMISLHPDNNSSQIKYNNESYQISKIYIVSPSIHLFQDKLASGEIIIEHNPILGGNTLSVSIPFTASPEITNASKLITLIIEKVATNAPNKGEVVNINNSDFTLQDIVPIKPFYTYTTNNIDWVVFDIFNAIPLSNNTLTTLNNIISPYKISTNINSDVLYYNSTGPNQTTLNKEGIYISCSPTGSSSEETEVVYNKDTTNYDLSSIFKKKSLFFQILFSLILFILFVFLLNFVYKYFISEKQSTNIIKNKLTL